jgi:hypothetical protein
MQYTMPITVQFLRQNARLLLLRVWFESSVYISNS